MSKEKSIRVLFKEPDKAPEWRTILNELDDMQALVNGYLEAVAWDDRYLLIVNEEGKLQDLPVNFVWFENHDAIVGPCFWAARSGEEFASILDDGFIDEINDYTGYGPDDEDDILEYGIDLDDLLRELIERNGQL